MNILFNLPKYVPDQMAGAETMAHRMAKYLVSKGHTVTILYPHESRVYEGVTVKQWERRTNWQDENIAEFRAADLVFTHLGQTADTFNKARLHGKKIVHIIHNSWNMQTLRCRVPNNYVVYNSQWVKDTLDYPHEGVILNPPVDYREYSNVKTDKAKYVTLINLNDNKGGQVLIELAKRLPDVKFLGVEGGYYEQIKDTTLPNIKYMGQTKDIRTVLKDTKILLVPSEYESWGQVGIEAAACGIPVIATPTPGLLASLGESALYCERNDLNRWEGSINGLLSAPELYKKQSAKAKARAKALDPQPQLETFEKWLHTIHAKPYHA